MKSSSKLRSSAEIEIAISDLPSEHRRAYVVARAIDRLICEHEEALNFQLAQINLVFLPHLKDCELKVRDVDCAISNATGQVFSVATPHTAGKLAELRELKTVFGTPELAAAFELLDQLLLELAAARAAEAEAEAAASHARQLIRDEVEARRVAALAELEAEEAAALAAV